MPSLLDLSDDTILHIAQYLNEDNSIPFPSFTPHWQNFQSEITSQNALGLRRLRATCRRTRDVLKLNGLHMVVTKWGDMVSMMRSAPDSVLSGVRRLLVNISRPVPVALVSSWLAFTIFLTRLTHLEELIIADLSLCRHEAIAGEIAATSTLPLPPAQQNILPKLSALAVQCTCQTCSAAFTVLLAVPAPNIRHLKFTCWPPSTPVPTSSRRNQNPPLQLIASEWGHRHGGGCIPLRALHVKDAPPFFLSEAGRELSYLTHLHQQRHSDYLYMDYSLTSRDMEKQYVWTFTINHQDSSVSSAVFLSNLSSAPRLYYLDFGIQLLMPAPEDRPDAPKRGDTRSTYEQRRRKNSQQYQDLQQYHTSVRIPTITRAASHFMDHVPSLRGGAFWEFIGVDNVSGEDIWHRWSWSAQSRGNGLLQPKVCKTPEVVSEGFMLNYDGQGEEERSQAGSASEWE